MYPISDSNPRSALDVSAQIDNWGKAIPSDVLTYIFANYMAIFEIIKVQRVNRKWCVCAKNPIVGKPFLEGAKLKEEKDEPWIKTYSLWLNTHYYIKLDNLDP